MRPIVVGLTGSFGAGKSTVARFFKEQGAGVLSADRFAHEVFRKGNRSYARAASLFPELRGNLSRPKIAEIVFRNPKRKRSLELVVHPYVWNRIRERLQRTRKKIVILEVPLLFESGFDRQCDVKVVVGARRVRVLQRLRARGYPPTAVQARWRAQMPLERKRARADYFIDNSGGLRWTRHQVREIWKKLFEERERSSTSHAQRKK